MKKANVAIFLKQRFKIWKLPEGADQKLRARFPEVIFKITGSDDEFRSFLKECEILLCWRLKKEFLPYAEKLKWVHTAMAGIEDFMYPEFTESDIVLTNSSGVASVGIAEHVLGMMLSFSRKIFESAWYQFQGEYGRFEIWEGDPVPFELEGKTIGIIGYGSIGREIASRCKALGMKVIALKRTTPIEELLKISDFVTVTLPLTDETRGMIGEQELKMMKRDAYLINIARGEIIQEKALIKALKDRWIAGAALDVFEKEPLPKDHPFYKMSNVLITPHISGTNPEYMNRVVEIFMENLERYLEGKPLKNIIDKKLGY
jgi:phosphoglycerate dehydrogenase-like enzyme